MKWRRTNLIGADGSLPEDDWTLYADNGRSLARIYFINHGPQQGRWFWAVQVDQQGRSFNGGTGHAGSGRQAKEECEVRLSVFFEKSTAQPYC
jgi:hypothetical protein